MRACGIESSVMKANGSKWVTGLIVLAAAIIAPTTLSAAKHRHSEKAASTHARRGHSSRAEGKRRKLEDAARQRAESARSDLSEIEKRWSTENVEPELPEQ